MSTPKHRCSTRLPRGSGASEQDVFHKEKPPHLCHSQASVPLPRCKSCLCCRNIWEEVTKHSRQFANKGNLSTRKFLNSACTNARLELSRKLSPLAWAFWAGTVRCLISTRLPAYICQRWLLHFLLRLRLQPRRWLELLCLVLPAALVEFFFVPLRTSQRAPRLRSRWCLRASFPLEP